MLTVIPGDKEDVVDLTSCEHNKENVLPLPPLPKITVAQGVSNWYINLINEEQLKNEGRKKRN